MKLCTIVPLNQKEWMNDRPYTMLLAHLSKAERSYGRWASQLNSYKIMDNSIIELGEAFTLEELLKQASTCHAQEIILPDVFQDGKATIELAKQSYQKIKNSPYKNKFKLMVVCHGKTEKEIINNFHALESCDWVDTIGMPKVITSWGNRNQFQDLYMKTRKEVHYLGCWSSFKEIEEIKDKPVFQKIRTMDTCLPALLSIQGKKWNEERDHSYTIDLIKDNVPKKAYKKIMEELKDNLGLE